MGVCATVCGCGAESHDDLLILFVGLDSPFRLASKFYSAQCRKSAHRNGKLFGSPIVAARTGKVFCQQHAFSAASTRLSAAAYCSRVLRSDGCRTERVRRRKVVELLSERDYSSMFSSTAVSMLPLGRGQWSVLSSRVMRV